MIVHATNRFIMIAIPKTASGSLRTQFNGRQRGQFYREPRHGTILHAKEQLGVEFDKYFKFAFVRNPWDRMLSWYMWGVKKELKWLMGAPTFKHWLLDKESCLKLIPDVPLQKQYQVIHLCDENGILIMDFIGRFEELNKGCDHLCQQFKIKRLKLPHTHKTIHKPYTEIYDNEMVDFIAEHHKRDIEEFGYQFGD